MKGSACSGQYRRSKHFTNRNVHICHTVLEVCLFLRICESMEMDQHICFIVTFSLDFHPFAGIQSIDDRLLNRLVFLIVQCIDLDNLTEDLREFTANGRNRICNNGKASLVPFNIAVCDLAGFIIQFQLKFLLCFCKIPALRLAHR